MNQKMNVNDKSSSRLEYYETDGVRSQKPSNDDILNEFSQIQDQ